MLGLFVALCIATPEVSVCDLLNFDPTTCASFFGCAYCMETEKCYATHPIDGSPAYQCPSSNSIKNSKTKLGKCFSLYSDDGCQKCVSRDATASCGWCQSLGVCAEGTPAGPDGFECAGDDWIFNKTTCERSICASAKTEENCRMPCVWSKRGVCILPAHLENAASGSQVVTEVARGKRVFLVVGIVCGVIAIGAIVAVIWKSSMPLYKRLPMMNNDYNLDQLPVPRY